MEEGCLDTEGPPSPLRIENNAAAEGRADQTHGHSDTVIASITTTIEQ